MDNSNKADSHLSGKNCFKCGNEKIGEIHRKSLDQFISECIQIYGDKYDYSKFIYKNLQTKSIIICKQHGPFEQKPSKHLIGQNGCSKCGNYTSENKCVKIIELLTSEKFNKIKPDFLKISPKIRLEIDSYNNDLKLALEYNGEQHYKLNKFFHKNKLCNLLNQQKRDKIKKKLCKENGIYLIIVPYWIKNIKNFIIEEYENYLFLRNFNI